MGAAWTDRKGTWSPLKMQKKYALSEQATRYSTCMWVNHPHGDSKRRSCRLIQRTEPWSLITSREIISNYQEKKGKIIAPYTCFIWF